MDRGEAPGEVGPLFDGLSPPPLVDAPPDVRSEPATQEEEEAAAEADQAATDAADAAVAERAQALAQFVTGIANAQRRYSARPQPTPYRALETAKELLRGNITPNLQLSPFSPIPQLSSLSVENGGAADYSPYPQELLGPGADLLREQAAKVVGLSRPTDLGWAYLQGVGLGLFDAAADVLQGLAEAAANPIAAAIRQKAQIVEAIDQRIAQGESPWEAANNVLNPVVLFNNQLERFSYQAQLANEIAGRALDAASGHDWDEAVRLSREAGRAAAGGGVSVVGAYNIASNTIAAAGAFAGAVRRRPSRTLPPAPPTPPVPPRPRQSPQPDGASGPQLPIPSPARTPSEVDPIKVLPPREGPVTGTIYRNGAQRPQLPLLFRPHPAVPELPVFDRSFLLLLREFQKKITNRARADGLMRKQALPKPRTRREASQQYLSYAKETLNGLEQETAIESALANPTHGYLTQVRIIEVERRAAGRQYQSKQSTGVSVAPGVALPSSWISPRTGDTP
jgi:hypothetical protein